VSSNRLEPISLDAILAARDRIAGIAIRTPVLALESDAKVTIHVKLENLQPIGSFKLRGAANAIALADPAELARRGVYTASAGNMAQGVAWNAQRLGIHCSVVVPDHAPQAKLAPVEQLGARIVRVPFDTWWQVLVDHGYPGLDGVFIHPVSDPAVIAGNGTIGLELAEQLPEMTAVVVPYGGGGLACGIATAVKALRPDVRVYAVEVETAAPLTASLAAGHPVEVDYRASWVDGIGSRSLLAEIWPLASTLLDGSITVTLAEVAEAVRLLAIRGRVVAEGAGASPVAAALTGRAGPGPVVAVVSGGGIDPSVLGTILEGGTP
jgi:threonine dehydratase